MNDRLYHKPIRSFIRRGRMTTAQQDALESFWSTMGLESKNGLLNYEQIFERKAPCVLEIGFGMGESLLKMAMQNPEINFLGIEVHSPGVGTLLKAIQENNIKNIRIYREDALIVLKQCLPDNSLQKILILFPDPWPKRRHHKRRLIQPEFVKLLESKLIKNGILHLATDWEDYARHMLKVLSQNQQLENISGVELRKNEDLRPITKYARRGLRLGHACWDLLFRKL